MNSSGNTLNRSTHKAWPSFAEKLAANVKVARKHNPSSALWTIIIGGLVLTNTLAFADPAPNIAQIPQAQSFNVPQFSPNGAFGNEAAHQAEVAGVVVDMAGFVRVIEANGSVHVAKMGDSIHHGDVIVTAPNAHICLKIPGAAQQCIGPGQKYRA